MKLILIIVLSLFLLEFQNSAFSQTQQAEFATVASIKFTIPNAGIPVTGTIAATKAKIKFDPLALSESTIEASADPGTVETGIAIRDKHLKRSDYFDVANFPSIHLISKTFRRTGSNTFTGAFDLTIKGITRPVTISFSLNRKTNLVQYKGHFTINRLDFHLGEVSAVLTDKIAIEVEAIAVDE